MSDSRNTAPSSNPTTANAGRRPPIPVRQRMRRILRPVLGVLAAVFLALASLPLSLLSSSSTSLTPQTAQAAGLPTYTVNSTADAVDASPGNGACSDLAVRLIEPEGAKTYTLQATGVCTLRAAIQEANANVDGGAIITLPAGTYQLTRSGADDMAAAGDLDITKNITINGAAGTGCLNPNALLLVERALCCQPGDEEGNT